MKITVAGNKKEYEDGITVAELIVKENVENPEYVTVTFNDDFVERDDFETTKLNEGDAVEFLYFMGGPYKQRVSGSSPLTSTIWPGSAVG